MKVIDDILKLAQTRFTSAASADLAMLPADMKIDSLERFQDVPKRRRGTVVLKDLVDFQHYLGAYGDLDNSAVFLSAQDLYAEAVLNHAYGDGPDWQDDLVLFEPAPMPVFEALLGLIGRPPAGTVGQQALLDFLDDYGHQLTFSRDGKTVPFEEARAAWAKLTITKLNEATSDRSKAYDRRLSETERLTLGNGLPTFVVIETPMYRGFKARRMLLDLRAAANAGALAVEVRIREWRTHEYALLADLRETVVSTSIPAYVGTLARSTRTAVVNGHAS